MKMHLKRVCIRQSIKCSTPPIKYNYICDHMVKLNKNGKISFVLPHVDTHTHTRKLQCKLRKYSLIAYEKSIKMK